MLFLNSVRRALTTSPPAYGLYARESVDNCERLLKTLFLGKGVDHKTDFEPEAPL